MDLQKIIGGKIKDLRSANLRSANLPGAELNWQSHELLSEILRQNAKSIDQFMVAGLLLVKKELCWKDFKSIEGFDELKQWAFDVFRQYGYTE